MADEESSKGSARGDRLHQLSGLALVAFVIVHIAVQGSALGGSVLYDRIVGGLARAPASGIAELVLVGIPLAIHAAYGLRRMRAGLEHGVERWGTPRLRRLQRFAALAVLVFLLVHLWELRFARLTAGLSERALYTMLSGKLSSTWAGLPWRALFYLVAVFATAFHAANGLQAARSPGPTAARRGRNWLPTALLGGTLALVGGATVIGLATGTRLLPGSDDDSGRSSQVAPCGSAVRPAQPPLQIPKLSPAPSR